MRKSLWIMLAVLFVAVSAPNAHADTFTYTYTSTAPSSGISWATAPLPGVTMQTLVPSAELTAASVTGPDLAGCVTTSVILDYAGTGGTETLFTGCITGAVLAADGFAASDYVVPGTYHGVGSLSGDTMVVAAVATPEPSSVGLMLLGVGLVFGLRKRNSRGHQLAT